MKVSRLQRILRLVNVLQTDRCYSAHELAELLEVSRRTVFRDLNMLYEAGFPYTYDEDQRGYRLDADFFLPPMNLRLSEALSLMMLGIHGSGKRGLPLQHGARDAVLKIESTLPAGIRRHCGSVIRSSSVHLPAQASHDVHAEIFSLLQKAIRTRRQAKAHYTSFYEQDDIVTTLNPLHLHFSQRAWYVIGYSSLHKENRIFKLARIRRLQLLPSVFAVEKPFDIDEYLDNAWSLIPEGKHYMIRLLFEPKVASNVAEVLWHPTQKTTFRADGRLLFEATVNGLNEISWWILGYGDQVRVVAPQRLRRRIAETAQRMAELYQEPARAGQEY